MTQQPVWKLVANLGDVNPVEYGGYFVFVDETGVYSPEAEFLISPDSDEGGNWIVYRFQLDKCTFIDGVLSDNEFHPELSAWFAGTEAEKAERPQDSTYLSNIASFTEQTEQDLIQQLCSNNPLDRAQAYRAIGRYHGFENLDSYPLTLTKDEAIERYKEE